MGLHMVAIAKLHVQLTSHSLSPVVCGLACPLALKLLMGFRLFREAYTEALYASRLFLFRLGQIAFGRRPLATNGHRLERAIRLISQTINNSAPLHDQQLPPDTILALSMLSL
ncbi:hypothetical protein L6164_019619 [Bauhinia variegata]|uniref:Uncharacterized protein n=1 Tax=Bauhinia variegata TaxID=167791 RepID=A0ACB9MSP6_BAUVA|nr:hypothetical protein L6164_019619 [Bauhinia variegata]